MKEKKMKWYQSMKTALFVSYFFISFIPLIVFSFTANSMLIDHFEDKNEKELLYQANQISGSIKKSGYLTDSSKKNLFDYELEEKSKEKSCRILVLDKQSVVVNDSNKSEIGKTYLIPEVVVAMNGKDDANLHRDENAIYAAAYIENDSSERIGTVLVVSSFEDASSLVGSISGRWILLTLVISAVIAAIVFLITQIFMEPIKNILNIINKITDGQLHQRIETKGHNEISQLSDAVNKMTEKLEQVETSRQEFVSNVSHELKTPLSSIKVLSDSILFQDEMPTDVYKEFLQDINSEIDRMTLIINDLLSLVKLDYKEAGLNIEEADLNIFCENVCKRLKPLADKKNISLKLVEENKDCLAEIDRTKFSLAISNLIENAIKYTDNGGEVIVTLDGDHQNVFISVKDTGIGISEDEQDKIFNRFYRVDKTRDRETGGTGLGLAITHSAVLLHGGSIKVQSAEGEGSTFLVRIPIKHIEQ